MNRVAMRRLPTIDRRKVLTALGLALCAASLWAVAMQRQQLARLRAGQGAGAAEPTTPAEPSLPPADQASTTPAAVAPGAVPSELLRLRSQVTQLYSRKRELAAVAAENERLRAQLESASGTPAGGTPLPPGYLRKSQAQLVGYSTPENTVQSFLWALEHHDVTRLLEAFAPEAAQSLQAEIRRRGPTPESFFKTTERLPGLVILDRRNLPDGSVELQVEFAPGFPPDKLALQPIAGQWKLVHPL